MTLSKHKNQRRKKLIVGYTNLQRVPLSEAGYNGKKWGRLAGKFGNIEYLVAGV